jgi:glycerol-3-phosphate dehydrogenase
MRFVLPVGPNSRPRWMLQLGLWLYDRIGGFQTLPKSETLDLGDTQYGAVLNSEFANGFAYSDCWVDDA